MDALYRIVLCSAALTSWGASIQTPNFVVHAPDAALAQEVARAAETYRKELSIHWTGREMPTWYHRCPIVVKPGDIGAGGATTFNFEGNEVHSWKMNIQGTPERILDSVLPHEINHTVFACYYRRPLPRWADEGAASLIEHESERLRLLKLAQEAFRSGRKIPLPRLLALREYPADKHQILVMYAEGYTLADFLVQRGGRKAYLNFLQTAHQSGWDVAFRKHYGIQNLAEFEPYWERWVLAGAPPVEAQDRDLQLAKEGSRPLQPQAPRGAGRSNGPQIRSQSPDADDQPLPVRRSAAEPLPPTPPLVAARLSRDLLRVPIFRVGSAEAALPEPQAGILADIIDRAAFDE